MYRILTSKAEIAHAQKRLFAQISKGKKMSRSVGYQGGSVDLDVYWHAPSGIWGGQAYVENRHWTAFGIQDPTNKNGLSISVEINSPFEGTSRQIQGVFLKDDRGVVHLGHRGKINLVSMKQFKKEFRTGKRGEWVQAIDQRGECEVLRLYPIDDPDVVTNIADFVKEAQRIKNLQSLPVKRSKTPPVRSEDPAEKPYNHEFEGESVYVHGQDRVVTKRRHGKIANALKTEVESYCKSRKMDFRLSNDPYDLLLIGNDEHKAMFECKTSSDSTTIHTAVGQLMLYSLPLKGKPEMIAVLPKETSGKTADNLRRLGLSVLYYEHRRIIQKFWVLDTLLNGFLERD